jgi:hypothetical protein
MLGDIMTNDRSTQLIVEIAKLFISHLQATAPDWRRAFLRFHADDAHYGSTASYETPSGVFLISVIKYKDMYAEVNSRGWELRSVLPGVSPFCVFVLAVTSDFDYKFDFERVDKDRWKITKMAGASGIPQGF